MSKIDTNKWKSFVVGDLFSNIKKPYVLHSHEVYESENGIPYVVRSKFNNGIKCLVEPVEGIAPSPAGVITWGAENASFFYQEKPFYSGRDIYYIDTSALSKETCLFIASCLQTISKKYAYNFGLFPDLLKKEKIKLPVKADGSPNWDYMENYMKNVINKSDNRLNNLKYVDNKVGKLNTDSWKKFAIGDLFDIARPQRRVQLEYEEGPVPFVSSGNYNNGILKTVKPDGGETLDKGNCLTISPVDGSTFYQEKDFLGRGGAGSAIFILRSKHLKKLNGLFLSAVIRNKLAEVKYNDQLNNKSIAESLVPLPVTSSGDPDWKYMEDYMQQVFDKSEDRLKKLRTAIK